MAPLSPAGLSAAVPASSGLRFVRTTLATRHARPTQAYASGAAQNFTTIAEYTTDIVYVGVEYRLNVYVGRMSPSLAPGRFSADRDSSVWRLAPKRQPGAVRRLADSSCLQVVVSQVRVPWR